MQTKLYDIKEWCNLGFEPEDYPYIGTINGEVNLHEVIKIGSRCYIPCAVNPNKHTAGVRISNVIVKPAEETFGNKIVCPYCGYDDIDSFECGADEDIIECGRCGATIEYTREVTVEYVTNGKKPPVIKKREFVKETE